MSRPGRDRGDRGDVPERRAPEGVRAQVPPEDEWVGPDWGCSLEIVDPLFRRTGEGWMTPLGRPPGD